MATRAEIDQAKADVLAAQEQIEESRTNIYTTEQNISSELGKLSPRKRIPYTPRQTRAAKLKYRRSLFGARGETASAREQLIEQEAEIGKYQTDVLQPAETELLGIEAHNREVAAYNAAVASVKKFASKGKVHLLAFWGEGLEKSLAKDYLKMQNAQKDQFRHDVQEFQQSNPDDKLLVDWDNLRVTGVESGTFKQSMSIAEFNKKISAINTNITPKLTQGEILSTGGGVFFTPAELEERGITTDFQTGGNCKYSTKNG